MTRKDGRVVWNWPTVGAREGEVNPLVRRLGVLSGVNARRDVRIAMSVGCSAGK
jgi:hypothetical protein